MSRWYVVATQPGREALAERHLRRQEFNTFVARRWRTVRHARKVRDVASPLFPGYLFVFLDPQAVRWRSINGTVGVRYLIAAGDQPLALPSGFVEALIDVADASGVVSFAPMLEVGAQVSVMSGPFAGHVGKLAKLDDRGRVRVLLELLSTEVPVETRITNLLPAN
jgi:transcriptional antiterminator RfaH